MINLVLDSGVVGLLSHPNPALNRRGMDRLFVLTSATVHVNNILLPEIADYEVRRKLLHLVRKGQASSRSILQLDELRNLMEFLPIDSEAMRRAAELWAESRIAGRPTAGDDALDGDVILAAQAEGVDGIVLTDNIKHFEHLAPCQLWTDD